MQDSTGKLLSRENALNLMHVEVNFLELDGTSVWAHSILLQTLGPFQDPGSQGNCFHPFQTEEQKCTLSIPAPPFSWFPSPSLASQRDNLSLPRYRYNKTAELYAVLVGI